MSSITNGATSSPMDPKVVEPSSSSSSSSPLSLRPLHVPSSSSLVSLPEDIICSCLAGLSKSYYPKFSLVSKSFNSILSSSQLYETRYRLKTTERFIYICLWFPTLESFRWFSLSMNPNQTLTGDKIKEKVEKKMLIHIPYSQSLPASRSTVAVGPEIYVLGGTKNDEEPSSTVRVLHCHGHTWRDAPSMMVARKDATAGVLNGKIYVLGGCDPYESLNWGEVFDTKTQTWEPLPSPSTDVRRALIKKMFEFKGKFYVNVRGVRGVSYVYAYDPENCIWERCGGEANHWMKDKACCVIENVLYCYGSFGFNWYDMESGIWRDVKGLDELQSKFHSTGGLRVRGMFEANNDGNVVIFWDGVGFPGPNRTRKRNIWCAEIALERHDDGGEIWGKLEWIDNVLTVPYSYEFMRCLSITV